MPVDARKHQASTRNRLAELIHGTKSPATKWYRPQQQERQMESADFDNQLVRQKDKIIDLIDSGKLQEAKAALAIVSEMWTAHNYDYKIRELQDRIQRKQDSRRGVA